MLEIGWSVDPGDYVPGTTESTIVRRVARDLHPGGIVLPHDLHAVTVSALPRLLALLRTRHLRPVTVPELLRTDAPSYRQLGRTARSRLRRPGHGRTRLGKRRRCKQIRGARLQSGTASFWRVTRSTTAGGRSRRPGCACPPRASTSRCGRATGPSRPRCRARRPHGRWSSRRRPARAPGAHAG
jgi:hypothetical protein